MSIESEQSIQQPDHTGLKRVGGAVALGFAVAGGLGIAQAAPAAAYERIPAGVTIEQGDTVWGIVQEESGAKGNALVQDVGAVARTNHLSDPSRIIPGQHLNLDAIKPSPQSHAPPGESYTLKYKDTIWDVVKAHYGYVSASLVKEVAQRSGIDMAEYYPGQVVKFHDPAQPSHAPQPVNHHPEKVHEIAKATVTIDSRDQTVWALSSIVAAMTKTSHEAAQQSIMAANRGLVPEQMQIGDKVVLPGVSDKTLSDVMNAIKFMAAYEAAPNQTPAYSNSDQALPIQAAEQPQSTAKLAQDIVNNRNITIEPSPNNRVEHSFQALASTGTTFTHDVNSANSVTVSPRLLQIVQGLAEQHPVTINSLTTGEHVPNSDHYKGEAIDLNADANSGDTFKELYDNRGALGIDELILANPPAGTTTLKNGQPFQYDDATLQEHSDHIHLSVDSKDPLPVPVVTPPAQPAPETTTTPAPEVVPGVEAVAPQPYSVDTNVLSQSGASVDQLNHALEGTDLYGLGQAFHDGEVKYGINAYYEAAHAAEESGWGKSEIAHEKNNLFGMSAFDSCPMSCAETFLTPSDSVDAFGAHLANDYLNPNGKWYSGGTNISNIFVHYSTAGQTEARQVSEIMNELAQKADG